MLTFLYDGSFEGMLTAIYEAWYSPVRPDRIGCSSVLQLHLGEELKNIITDPEKAVKVSDAIRQKLGREIYEQVLYAWMSEDPEAGTAVDGFLKLAFKRGPGIVRFESDPAVNRFLRLYRTTVRESHRMLGLARFIQLESGLYYCAVETDCNILMILSSHFADRLGDQPWVIHDVRRHMGAFYDTRQWQIRELVLERELSAHPEEKQLQDLWRHYFRHIAIAERMNPRLQRQMMPKKYWKYLTEKQPS